MRMILWRTGKYQYNGILNRMLIMILMLFMLCSWASFSLAETPQFVAGGDNRAYAVELHPGIFYQTEAKSPGFTTGEDAVIDGWYYVMPKEAGICVIYNRIVQQGTYIISYYDSKGNKLGQSDWFEVNKEGGFSFEVPANEKTYIRFFELGLDECWPEFTICFSDTHVSNGQPREIVYDATCTRKGLTAECCAYCGWFINQEDIPIIEHQESDTWNILQEASCEADGCRQKLCVMCGEALIAESIPATGHLAGNEVIAKEATCMSPGQLIVYCDACQSPIETKEIQVVEHDPGYWYTLVEATCLETGIEILDCEVCGTELQRETIAQYGHESSEWTETRPATCTSDGERVKYCYRCGEILDTEVIVAFGHDDGVWITERESMCQQSGIKVHYCTNCGAEMNSEFLPALGHRYTEWEMTIEATKTEEGERRRHCMYCGDTQYEAVEKLPAYTNVSGFFRWLFESLFS